MRLLWWLIPVLVGLAALWWAKLWGIAVLATLVSGLIGLTCLVMRIRGVVPPERLEEERVRQAFERDIPPRPG
jgi:hypothetical protein